MSIALHFDVIDYIEQAEKLGVPQALAKFQARKLEETIDTISEQTNKAIEVATTNMKSDLKDKDLATRGDVALIQNNLEKTKLELQKEIEMVRSDIKTLEVKLLTIYGAGFLILLGVLAKGFHWL